ncbi:Serine/threonine-protein kinase tel1 [Agyrium rufum]|nr:Serine/threonine-protein kinase tel1 [Agyrium rufum]
MESGSRQTEDEKGLENTREKSHKDSITLALNGIRSGTETKRKDGLSELDRIFIKDGKSFDRHKLRDGSYLWLLQELFQDVRREKSKYVKANATTTKQRSASALSSYALAIRKTVEHGVQAIRLKTVRALTDHIVQTLPSSDENFCVPLLIDYLKTLRVVLAYAPHPEHFAKEKWQGLVEFCLDGLRSAPVQKEDSSFIGLVSTSVRLPNRSSRLATPSTAGTSFQQSFRPRPAASQADGRYSTDSLVAEWGQCIALLYGVTNAPVLFDVRPTIETLIEVIQSSASSAISQQIFFSPLNSILSRSLLEDVTMTCDIIQQSMPLIQQHWDTKSTAGRDEMTQTLLYCSVVMPRLMLLQHETIPESISDVFQILQSEYCQRSERDQLQIDDLDLNCLDIQEDLFHPLRIHPFTVQPGSIRAEQPWVLLDFISSAILSLHQQSNESDNSSQQPPLKRQKPPFLPENLLEQLRLVPDVGKPPILQILTFCLQKIGAPKLFVQDLLNTIAPLVSSESISVSNWAILTISSTCFHDAAKDLIAHETWSEIWQVTSRRISNPSVSRTACHLLVLLLRLRIVTPTDVADTVEAILASADLNGPALLCDSSIELWCSLIDLKARSSPVSIFETSQRVITWLLTRWKPSKYLDLSATASSSETNTAQRVIKLLSRALGMAYIVESPDGIIQLGNLARAKRQCDSNARLIEYLFLLDKSPPGSNLRREYPVQKSTELKLTPGSLYSLSDDICRYMVTELHLVRQRLHTENPEEQVKLNAPKIKDFSDFLIVALGFSSHPHLRESRQMSQLREAAIENATLLLDHATSQESSRELVDMIISTCGAGLNVLSSVKNEQSMLSRGVLEAVMTWGSKLWGSTNAAANTRDFMDFDDNLESQSSGQQSSSAQEDMSREDVAASTSCAAVYNSTIAKIKLLNVTVTSDHDIGDEICAIPASFIDYLFSLEAAEFMSCRPFIVHLLDSPYKIELDFIERILEYLGFNILQAYEYERCEVGLGFCLDVMTSTANAWMDPGNEDLAESGSSFYEWFDKILLSHNVASPYVYIRMAKMLQRSVKLDLEYPKSLGLSSARTTLFKILMDASIPVKFYIGIDIADIFGMYVLKEHDNIVEDIIASLPSDGAHSEGISLRLFILGHLAAKWPTLLRRCFYAIFETPGHVPSSIQHAKLCLAKLSTSLGLQDSRALLNLFLSQVIFTWMETDSLGLIPYQIFGYSKLAEFATENQGEIIAQMVMRGKEDDLALLTDLVGQKYLQIVDTHFAKVAAYSIARDIALPPDQSSPMSQAKTRLREVIGKSQYNSLMRKNFPDIIATLIRSLDQEGHFRKHLQKQTKHQDVLSAHEEMILIAPSSVTTPLAQQPSFKAGYICDELEYLCGRTEVNLQTVWTPTLYVYCCRALLDTIEPALGSLNTCATIRRIRILIALSGKTVFSGYPLEMTLKSLRPFLTDTNCADDVIGIFGYLIPRSEAYLESAPNFIAGLLVTTLASLKTVQARRQDSTTQESQFKSTLQSVHQFQGWLIKFAERYSSSMLDGSADEVFKTLIASAQAVSSSGSATKGSVEASLLLTMLEDVHQGHNLLDVSSRDVVLDYLCREFQPLPACRDDILGSPDEASRHAKGLRTILHGVDRGENFSAWTARVLGLAYSGHGYVDERLLQEVDSKLLPIDKSHGTTSRCMVLHALLSLLSSPTRKVASIIERTLQRIASNSDRSSQSVDLEEALPTNMLDALRWNPYVCPIVRSHDELETPNLEQTMMNQTISPQDWSRNACIGLSATVKNEPSLLGISEILSVAPELSDRLLAPILHLALSAESGNDQRIRLFMSEACTTWFRDSRPLALPQKTLLLHAVLYLRSQPIAQESTKSERSRWLELDYLQAAQAAVECKMFKTALLLIEIGNSEMGRGSRRSSSRKPLYPTELLLEIFRSIDEPDSFYGIQQPSSLSSIMEQLEYENAGFKSLSFRAASYDGQVRATGPSSLAGKDAMINVLHRLELNGLTHAFSGNLVGDETTGSKALLSAARKLERWDVAVADSDTEQSAVIYRVFQKLADASDLTSIYYALTLGMQSSFDQLTTRRQIASSVYSAISSLAVLAEISEVSSIINAEQLMDVWSSLASRNEWMITEDSERIRVIPSCRQTLFSILSKSHGLRQLLHVPERDARRIECQALLLSSALSHHHEALQQSLSSTVHLNQLVNPCLQVGLKIDAAALYESSNVLWDQGEIAASVKILQDLQKLDFKGQDLPVGKAEVLAKLGYRASESRLEKPDEIIANYLTPAIKELGGIIEGDEAGQVFHQFAQFCDQQLQNTDHLEDFERMKIIRERRERELKDFDRLIKDSGSQAREKESYESHRKKARLWYELDNREYQRLYDSRQTLLKRSLENYLLALAASDEHDGDSVRFSALWLEHYNSETANTSVGKYLKAVPSRKFVPLMNQWTSRLANNDSLFQKALSGLCAQICVDHPYHGMYQIFASSKSNKGSRDSAANSRAEATNKIVSQIRGLPHTSRIWIAVHNSNINFVRFAAEKFEEDSRIKVGSRVPLKKSTTGAKLEQDVTNYKIPPPTMELSLRADRNYSKIPLLVKFLPDFTLASGISMPKIVTAVASDGKKYKQLFKAGNDDLRQDAIMEQVFAQVSSLLRTHRSTRQRDLRIRTYKVLPLTTTAGIIEFVSNTVPLHDYLMPAHQRHYPNDLKTTICRKAISDAQSKSVETRVKVFKQVTEKFNPVMRFFFMERFENPDEWFARRLAYTRSTAAISILGHVLGLGDRHGHNILLDEKTGEVVHIDLGIAFEQGRVLPIPEVVPFRLTRDLIDGMGITKTEGVFQRCCEFTLEALRAESYTIMTILDVLRYDPLYSWSSSPLRLKKVQQGAEQGDEDAKAEEAADQENKVKREGGGEERKENEPGEADRALEVVKKKLSKSLSVTATVNELIQQATDVRNLAVLFCGWAAYA